MQVQRRLGFIILITLSSFTTNALASCPRMLPGPPCVEYWRADAVFIGVATRVVFVPNETLLSIGPYLSSTVHLTIEEAFKGVGGTGLVLEQDHCGHIFKEGERYLVYARGNPNNQQFDVRVGSSRTRPLSEATEDLQYIRGLVSGEAGSRIFGTVGLRSFNVKKSNFDLEVLKNIRITLEGNDQRQDVLSDSEGRYEFKRVPAGTYRLQAELPAHLGFDKQTLKVTGRGCVPLDISAWNKGQVAGRVLDVNGKPLVGVAVSLVSADASAAEIYEESNDKMIWPIAYTNDGGRFVFSQLRAGRYLLVTNRTEFERSRARETTQHLPRLFYPGVNEVSGATVIVVGNDDEAREYDFRLP